MPRLIGEADEKGTQDTKKELMILLRTLLRVKREKSPDEKWKNEERKEKRMTAIRTLVPLSSP